MKRALTILVAALATPVLLATPPAFAQAAEAAPAQQAFPLLSSCDPIIPRRNRPGYSDDAATLRQNAIDILSSTWIANATWARTLAPGIGEAVVTEGAVRSGDIVLRAPVRHAEVGRVNGDVVAIPVFRERFLVLPAGAEVWKTHHVSEYQCRRDDIVLWCGQQRPATAYRHELQCFMPPDSDWLGIAEVRGNQYFPWGFVKFIEDATHDGVTLTDSIAAPAMEVRLAFERWRDEAPELRAFVWVEGGDDAGSPIVDIADVRTDERGAVFSLWGGEFLLRRGGDGSTATVEVLSPIAGFDPQWQASRLRARATARVDEELARRAEREARRR